MKVNPTDMRSANQNKPIGHIHLRLLLNLFFGLREDSYKKRVMELVISESKLRKMDEK